MIRAMATGDVHMKDWFKLVGKEINADFIVMCTHGRRGIAHLFIGSIAEDVMKNVDCALWIYKFKTNQK
jgi:nucleotide-binding universal stress UspA family protein